MNILITSIGKHAELVQQFKNNMGPNHKIIVTSNKKNHAANYFADNFYKVSDVKSEKYINEILNICKIESIDVVISMLDLETTILSKFEKAFYDRNIFLMLPKAAVCEACFDKLLFYKLCKDNQIPTIKTSKPLNNLNENTSFKYPLFVKPRFGRGSVGAKKVYDNQELLTFNFLEDDYIVQEYVEGEEYDVDVYFDFFTNKVVSIFVKKKLEMGIGGTKRAVSINYKELNDFIIRELEKLELRGPINVEVFETSEGFKIIEINTRFSAAYVHAISNNVNFFEFINNNVKGKVNNYIESNYEDNMMMIQYSKIINIKENGD